MLRDQLLNKQKNDQAAADFRWRGTDVTRLEGFTDSVLGFAITLLVVSLDVPNTFDELLLALRSFVPFGLCFAYLVFLWYQHYLYFRRYGLNTTFILWCNTVLLFVILMYVYPLKFLANYLLDDLVGLGAPGLPDSQLTPPLVAPDQLHILMIVYGLGFVAVRGMFVILYLYAWRQRSNLELTAPERFDTLRSIEGNVINVLVGCLSIAIAFWGGPGAASWAGWTYLLLFPTLAVSGMLAGRRRQRLFPAATPA
jgi:hypothetical protein